MVDDVENNKLAAWFVDTRAIVLAIYRQPGANTIIGATIPSSVVDFWVQITP